MKKIFAILLIAILSLSAVAFAETCKVDDIAFDYDPEIFDVSFEDRADDETTVVLSNLDETWEQVYIRFYVRELEDGETFPTLAEFPDMGGTEVTQGEWNGFDDVFMYSVAYDDGTSQHFFIAPVADDDGEIEASLTVEIGITELEDEDVAMTRDDQISAVLDTIKVVD